MAFKTNVETCKSDLTKHSEEKKGFSKRLLKTWKPREGKNNVRVLPAWSDTGPNAYRFYREAFSHWNIGSEDFSVTMTCPRKTAGFEDKECPVCEECTRLYATKDPADAVIAKSMYARRGFMSNIVDNVDPVWTAADLASLKESKTENLPEVGTTKVQVWSYGITVWNALMNVLDSVDFTDLEDGANIVVDRSGTGMGTDGKEGTKYIVQAERNNSALKVHGELDLYNLDELYPPKSVEDMNLILSGINPYESKMSTGKQLSEGKKDEAPKALSAPPPKVKPVPEPAKDPAWLKDGKFVHPADYSPCFSTQLDVTDATCKECAVLGECQAATAFKVTQAKAIRQPPKTPAKAKAAPVVGEVSQEISDIERQMKAALGLDK
jgi:hypothetical protein